MNGLRKINDEVRKILLENNPDFRVWRTRFKNNLLSLEKKIQIVEKYGKKNVTVTINERPCKTVPTE